MRILILSDIHANWPALRAIDEPFDVCLFLGDLVDYGVQPLRCIEWARQHVTYGVRGNHDHGVAQQVRVRGIASFRYLASITRPWTIHILNLAQRRYLASLPVSRRLMINDKRFLLVHATPRDPLDEYGKPSEEFWEPRVRDLGVDFLCVGHSHTAYCLDVNGTKIINPGSVGLPRDGDPRVSYAIIDGDSIELKRVEYRIENAVSAVEQSPIPKLAKTLLTEVYRTGRIPPRTTYAPAAQANGNGKPQSSKETVT